LLPFTKGRIINQNQEREGNKMNKITGKKKGKGFELFVAAVFAGCLFSAPPAFAQLAVPSLNWFLVEFDGGVLLNAGAEVSILRAQCREDVDGIILQVQGGAHDPAAAVVTITDTDAGTNFGTATAVPDAANPTFGLYDFQTPQTNLFTVCPTSVTASAGAANAVSPVDVRAAVVAPVATLALEGPVSAVVDNLDGTATITVMGIPVLIPATAPINSPSAVLTPALLVDPTPLPGRSLPGFTGATAIINGQTVGGQNVADDVFVEPAENVLIGTVSAATCTNADCSGPGDSIAVLGTPLTRLTDVRIPAGPAKNAFGFAINLAGGGLVGGLVSAEGYFGQVPTVTGAGLQPIPPGAPGGNGITPALGAAGGGGGGGCFISSVFSW
jgi:hypothetical protein